MKIIKEGNVPENFHPKRFVCRGCNCIFEATNSEYRVEADSVVQETVAKCTCPCCGIDVRTSYY